MSSEITFGEWLKRRRKQLDITQNELADQLGCSINTVRKIEQNARRPSKQLAELLGNALNIPDEQINQFITFARTETYLSPGSPQLEGLINGTNQTSTNPIPAQLESDGLIKTGSAKRVRLPAQSTRFIGREDELNQIHKLLTDPNHRLVTIIGPGGMGKSRLAIAAGESLIEGTHFKDGLFFVPLAPLNDGKHILPAIASALEITLTGVGTPVDILISYLKRRDILLILDNCEHLIDELEFINQVLQGAPRVTILATTRERLRLYSEQLIPIEGFDLPSQTSEHDITDLNETNPAVQLFKQTAQRVNPNIQTDEKQINQIIGICRLVTGMPLAIELAATWIDLLSLADIEKEIQRSIDFLETDLRGVPARHRSLRAIFHGTWLQMTADEQAIFTKLSIFRGGFTKEAAQTVTSASIRQLSRLVSKSLLTFDHKKERYQIHELLRQFGADLLAQSDSSALETFDRYSHYYCGFIQNRESALITEGVTQAIYEISMELDNIRAAWQHVVQTQNFQLMEVALDGLFWYYYWPARHQEWNNLFNDGIERIKEELEKRPEDRQLIELRLRLLAWYGEHNLSKGPQVMEAISMEMAILIHQLKVAGTVTDEYEAHYFKFLSSQHYYVGDIAKADQFAAQQLLHLRQANNQLKIASTLNEYARREDERGNYETAEMMLRESLEIAKEVGNPYQIIWPLLTMGNSIRQRGKLDQSADLLKQALDLSSSIHYTNGILVAKLYLGELCINQGKFESGLDYLNDVIRQREDLQNDMLSGWPETLINGCLLHLGRYDEAFSKVSELADYYIYQYKRTGWGLVWANLYLGSCAFVQEDLELTMSYAQSGFEMAEKLRLISPYGQAWVLQGMGLLTKGDRKRAEAALIRSLTPIKREIEFASCISSLALAAMLDAEEQPARAVERFSLANQFGYFRHSNWFTDVTRSSYQMAIDALEPAEKEAARARGQSLDLWEEAEKILNELSASA